MLGAFRQTVTNRQTLGYALAAGGVMGSLFAYVFSSQQVFTGIYRLGHYFPMPSRRIAVGTAIAGFLNARFVGRLGMRVISHGALIGFARSPASMLAAAKLQMLPLPLFMALSALMMFSFGLMIANFTALAMEPQGHIAGTASSLYGSITTLLGIGIGTTIGQDYRRHAVAVRDRLLPLHAGVAGGGAGGGKGPAVQAASSSHRMRNFPAASMLYAAIRKAASWNRNIAKTAPPRIWLRKRNARRRAPTELRSLPPSRAKASKQIRDSHC